MTPTAAAIRSERVIQEQAAAGMLSEAKRLELGARYTGDPAKQLRLRGRALILRGSAWLIDADLAETRDA